MKERKCRGWLQNVWFESKKAPCLALLYLVFAMTLGRRKSRGFSLVNREETKKLRDSMIHPKSHGWLAKARTSFPLPRSWVQVSSRWPLWEASCPVNRTFPCCRTYGGWPPQPLGWQLLWPRLCAASSTMPPSCLSLPALGSLLLNDSHLPESFSQNPQWAALRTPHVW